jgi:hypothetical protein
MRVYRLLFFVAVAAGSAQASWFSSSSATPSEYTSWSSSDLKAWLVAHNVPLPSSAITNSPEAQREALLNEVKANWATASSWTQDQYYSAQSAFTDLRESAFDTWDESTLRAWLVEQGIVSPSSPKEELVLLAKHRYNSYRKAANQWAESAKDTGEEATASITSLASTATAEVGKALDDSKDYVYSSWDDNRLRSYLESKGVLKTKQQKTRDELLAMMKKEYAEVADPVWDAWSTSYIVSLTFFLILHTCLELRCSTHGLRHTIFSPSPSLHTPTNLSNNAPAFLRRCNSIITTPPRKSGMPGPTVIFISGSLRTTSSLTEPRSPGTRW